ncbi:MAG: hypothetical protein IJS88_05715 [Alphaproteobacteria bacterium]|nr:hypothetical protein [Alphaproteobacteria bacterium]
MEFIQKTEFLCYLFLALSTICFITVSLHSWYGSERPRRFWLARLTYNEDKEMQSFVRVAWLLALIFGLISSFCLMLCMNLEGFWLCLAQTLYWFVAAWILAKVILAAVIVFQYVGYTFIRLKNWILHDKPLFPKYEKISALRH